MNREQTTIRLPTDLKEQIQQEADGRGNQFSSLDNSCLNNIV